MSTTLPLPGQRVRVTGVMPDDPSPLPVGSTGTVREATLGAYGLPGQIMVDWDDRSRGLILLSTDPYEVIR